MKYKLINSITKEEYLCEKVTIDGFDYYVSDKKIHFGYVWNTILEQIETMFKEKTFHNDLKGIIATSNPNIDIGQVVSEEDMFADEWCFSINGEKFSNNDNTCGDNFLSFKSGFNRSKGRYQFSKETMVSFGNYLLRMPNNELESKDLETHLINWEELQPKIVYYEP